MEYLNFKISIPDPGKHGFLDVYSAVRLLGDAALLLRRIDFTEVVSLNPYTEIVDQIVTDETKLIEFITLYAIYVLKRRWPQAEFKIFEDIECLYEYKHHFKIPFTSEEEDKILNSQSYFDTAISYLFNYKNSERYEPLEQKLLQSKNYNCAISYNARVIKDRWPEFEKLVNESKNPKLINNYHTLFLPRILGEIED